ncbi:hypothetical protein ACJMK2_007922 [Sinanodonta woodiana]|uniref:Protein kinase domain-containing protein n=1 Tax=Sinanodonta woodiana TaxID=1069815 RepID=A0ABD3VJY9_SINWO
MMEMLYDNAKVNDTILNPSGTLFICNKWDLVPPDRKESFQSEIMKRLQNIWPGIMEEQLVPFSATQALNEIIDENPSEQYCNFMRHICNLVDNAVHLKLEKHCLWLLRLLERASALVKNCKKLEDYAKQQKEELLKRARHFKSILSTLNKRCTDTVSQIEKNGMEKLKSSIKSCMEINASELCKWSNEDIPTRKQDEDWGNYRQRLEIQIRNRIQSSILQDNRVICIIHDYQKDLNEINEVLSKENNKLSMFGPDSVDESAVGFVSWITFFIKVLSFVLFRPNFYLILDLKSTTNDVYDKEETFGEDPLNYMTIMTAKYVESIQGSKLSSVALGLFKDVQDKAKEIKTNILKRVKTIDTFCNAVSSEQFNRFKNTIFQTITSECSSFYFLEIMKHEIDSNRLMIDRNNLNDVIGKGGFGQVMKGSLQTEIDRIPIAAKIVVGEVISEDSSIFRECLLMRQLMLSAKTIEGGEFPPVVFYYGSSYSKINDMHEVIIVMELCDTDLHRQVDTGSLIPPNKGDIIKFPGAEKERKLRYRSLSCALDIALQAAKGISFIHKNGIVHRDVKPSNYLMCVRGADVLVKITDVGVSKEQDIITTAGQNIGTVLYHAPEICLNPFANHSFASDVYSFGLVLWEVWYGEHVFSEIPTNQFRTMKIMKPPLFRDVSPPKPLELLMQECWNRTTTNRPDMNKVVDQLTKILAQNPRILS